MMKFQFKKIRLTYAILLLVPFYSFRSDNTTIHYTKEKHLKNVKQLTFGGNNAEAYFSFNDKMIVFQSDYEKWNLGCDQIFSYKLKNKERIKDIKDVNTISTLEGRTTCAYFLPGNKEILFASTHEADKNCPPKPEPRADKKYVWPVYNTFDIYVRNLKTKKLRKLTDRMGYDAEATVSPKGDKIVFTSDRSGDLELWTMDIDGTNLKQITNELGYDGGAFFSPDGKKLVYRASRPKTDEEIESYKNLLKEGLVTPTEMEIFVCDIDGSNRKQITNLGKANWAPYFHPSGKKIVFSSNHHSSRGYNFNIFMIDLNGENLEQITFDNVFDAFPMFSFNGKKIIFSSNRNNGGDRSTNIFIADWVD